MIGLNKEDYQNLLTILESTEFKGVKNAQYVALLAMKLNAKVAEFDAPPPPPTPAP